MGLLSSTRRKHKLRISPDQQGRCWCSPHPKCLFHEGPVSHHAPSYSCPHGAWASLEMQHKAPETEDWAPLLDPVPYCIPVLGPGSNMQWGPHTSHYFCLWNSLISTSPAVCSLYFREPPMTALQVHKAENHYVKLIVGKFTPMIFEETIWSN